MLRRILNLSNLFLLAMTVIAINAIDLRTAHASNECGPPPDFDSNPDFRGPSLSASGQSTFTGTNSSVDLLTYNPSLYFQSWLDCEIQSQTGASNFALVQYLSEMLDLAFLQKLTATRVPAPYKGKGAPKPRYIIVPAQVSRPSMNLTGREKYPMTLDAPTANALTNEIRRIRTMLPTDSCQLDRFPVAPLPTRAKQANKKVITKYRYCVDQRGRAPQIIQNIVTSEINAFRHDPVSYFENKVQNKMKLNLFMAAFSFYQRTFRIDHESSPEWVKQALDPARVNHAIMFAIATGVDSENISHYIGKGQQMAQWEWDKANEGGGGFLGFVMDYWVALVENPKNIVTSLILYYTGGMIADQLTAMSNAPSLQSAYEVAAGQAIANGAYQLSTGKDGKLVLRDMVKTVLSAGIANEVGELFQTKFSGVIPADKLLELRRDLQVGLQSTLESMTKDMSFTDFLRNLVKHGIKTDILDRVDLKITKCKNSSSCLQSAGEFITSQLLSSYANKVLGLLNTPTRRSAPPVNVSPQPPPHTRMPNRCVISKSEATISDCDDFKELGADRIIIQAEGDNPEGIDLLTCELVAEEIANNCGSVYEEFYQQGVPLGKKLVTGSLNILNESTGPTSPATPNSSATPNPSAPTIPDPATTPSPATTPTPVPTTGVVIGGRKTTQPVLPKTTAGTSRDTNITAGASATASTPVVATPPAVVIAPAPAPTPTPAPAPNVTTTSITTTTTPSSGGVTIKPVSVGEVKVTTTVPQAPVTAPAVTTSPSSTNSTAPTPRTGAGLKTLPRAPTRQMSQ